MSGCPGAQAERAKESGEPGRGEHYRDNTAMMRCLLPLCFLAFIGLLLSPFCAHPCAYD